SFSFTATLGALLTFALFILYPRLMEYLVSIFDWTFVLYACTFFLEAGFLYSYYYGWGKVSKKVHLLLGLGLNLVGIAIIFIADAWLTFMNSPDGVDADQHPSAHCQHLLRWIDRSRVRRLQVPGGQDARGSRTLRLDGLRGQLHRHCRPVAASVRGLLPGSRDLRFFSEPGDRPDGRHLLVALHHPGRVDRESLSGRQLLSLAQH